jgi:hypothetical protein
VDNNKNGRLWRLVGKGNKNIYQNDNGTIKQGKDFDEVFDADCENFVKTEGNI